MVEGPLRKLLKKTGVNPHNISLALDDYAQEHKKVIETTELVEEGRWNKALEKWREYKGSRLATGVRNPNDREIQKIKRLIENRNKDEALDELSSFSGYRNAEYVKYIIREAE